MQKENYISTWIKTDNNKAHEIILNLSPQAVLTMLDMESGWKQHTAWNVCI